MGDKVIELLVDALKQALAEPGEQPLHKAGKLDGLFAGRTGPSGEAAEWALREGLLETVRSETKGKTTIEWVRPTARAAEFIQRHESPIQALKDLQAILQTNREKIPFWLADMQRDAQTFVERLSEEAAKWTHRLESLSDRVEQALRRVEAAESPALTPAAGDSLWAVDALAYLDRRRAGGARDDCPLPELFAALQPKYPELSVPAFHDGLRRLHDRRAIRLQPFAGSPNEMPKPEYALVEATDVLYFAAR
jgi:hypothetical protein